MTVVRTPYITRPLMQAGWAGSAQCRLPSERVSESNWEMARRGKCSLSQRLCGGGPAETGRGTDIGEFVPSEAYLTVLHGLQHGVQHNTLRIPDREESRTCRACLEDCICTRKCTVFQWLQLRLGEWPVVIMRTAASEDAEFFPFLAEGCVPVLPAQAVISKQAGGMRLRGPLV